MDGNDSLNNLVPVKEAAAILGVSIETLYRYEKKGYLCSLRTPGGHRRYVVSDLLDLKLRMKSGQFVPRPKGRPKKGDIQISFEFD